MASSADDMSLAQAIVDAAYLGVRDRIPAPVCLNQEHVQSLANLLHDIDELPNSTPQTTRSVTGGFHLNISNSLIGAIAAAAGVLLTGQGLEHVTAAAVGSALVSYVANLYTQLKKLTPAERQVFEAVAEITTRKAENGVIFEAKGANEAEIAERLEEVLGQHFLNLGYALSDLLIKGVLKRIHDGSGEPEYACVM